MRTGGCLETIKTESAALFRIESFRDGSRLLAGSADGQVILWDAQSNALRQACKEQTGAVTSVALSPNNVTAASAGQDANVNIWSV
jgi:WD40 repeat protein